MSQSNSGDDELIARFMAELQTASDLDSVVNHYCDLHPNRATDFRSIADAHRRMKAAVPESAEMVTRLVPGEMLGDFRVLRFLAHGGMGEIYEAEQVCLSRRRVALKVIRHGNVSPDARVRFMREQEVLAKLHQTNIVPVFAAGERDDLQYFAMQYIEGATLGHVVHFLRSNLTQGRTTSPTPSLGKLVESVVSPRVPPLSPISPTTEADSKSRDLGNANQALLVLTDDYCRSVAESIAAVADALDAAHRANVLHRDVKPSNLMAEKTGKCWVIDFGLASLNTEQMAQSADGIKDESHTLTAQGTQPGTLPYMAPEQFDGESEPRSDVWALGVTLYELLAIRRPFIGPNKADFRRQVTQIEPARLSSIVKNVPHDLEAICHKAMHKNRNDRYPTAAAFAADLRCWLNHEPTQARPAWVIRRTALWMIRNKGWAAAIAAAIVAAITLSVFTTIAEKHRADAAGARADVAVARADAAVKQLKERERGEVLRQAADARNGVRQNGWSQRSWELSAQAAKLRVGADARNEMASSLIGLDAKLEKMRNAQKTDVSGGVSDVVFSPDGRWVMAGGAGNEPTWLWNRETGEEKLIASFGAGPYGYLANGTPVQAELPTTKPQKILLRDLVSGKMIREFDPPGEPITMAVFSRDASLLAGESDKSVTVWDTTTGKFIRRIVTSDAAGLAFSPDHKLIAIGGPDGQVQLWPLPTGDALPSLNCGRTAVSALTFGPPVRPAIANQPISWRLAAGDDGGSITVWDLGRRRVLSICRGSNYTVHSVSLSPDGMTLASVGRNEGKLWDVSTGQRLLGLIPRPYFRNWMSAVAFSPDGSRVAIGSRPAFGSPGGIDIYELQNGRGVRTLRGMESPLTRMVSTADTRRIAALSQDWQIAIWDAEANYLLHLLDAPQGYFADNAGLAFSRDGKKFAFSTGREAVVWDVATGLVLDRYTLPPAMSDAITFHPDGKLYLFRCEVEDPKASPQDYAYWAKCPRICRVRELQPGGKTREVRKPITDYTGGVRLANASPDGRYFVVQGWDGASQSKNIARVYDSATGNCIWPKTVGSDDNWYAIDPTGQLLLVGTDMNRSVSYIEMPGGKLLDVRTGLGSGWVSPDAELAATTGLPPLADDRLLTLFEYRTNRQLVTFDTCTRVHQMDGHFSNDGTHFLWCNDDGSLMVCNLKEVNCQLISHGLGW